MRGPAEFLGEWRLARDITDNLTGQAHRFDGVARFAEADGGLTYHETGTLRIPGQPPMQGDRRYLWQFAEGRVKVLFEDGRFFHSFPLSDAAPEATHFCDPDDYAVRYAFADWPHWQATWTVRGPRKDYTSRTSYSR